MFNKLNESLMESEIAESEDRRFDEIVSLVKNLPQMKNIARIQPSDKVNVKASLFFSTLRISKELPLADKKELVFNEYIKSLEGGI